MLSGILAEKNNTLAELFDRLTEFALPAVPLPRLVIMYSALRLKKGRILNPPPNLREVPLSPKVPADPNCTVLVAEAGPEVLSKKLNPTQNLSGIIGIE